MRVRGELTPLREGELSVDEMEALLFEIVNPEQKKKITEQLDLDFAYAHPRARFRANYLYRLAGLGAVFRFIPTKCRRSPSWVAPRPSGPWPKGEMGWSW